ncbi:Kae1-associated serine/threonine protein kinase [Candidatus Micrarchaeota archaeon]|nr:Kae1-associated serine/threonine protein kinase [Candidatus Micrarchaeota archaeon]
MRGAEAVLRYENFLGRKIVVKERISKGYRIKELDEKIRTERTRREARLLHKAKQAGVSAPVVYKVDKYSLYITRIYGRRLKDDKKELKKAGEILALLHLNDIIHGDFTPNNALVSKGKIYIIDFGLGFFSKRIEDKADDIIVMLKGIENKNAFLKGYSKYKEYSKVIRKMKEILSRARYV